jgi:hypothetical protein
VSAVTLESVRGQADPASFPIDALEGCETALVLFAAAYYGRQDALWVADAGLRATCVDSDSEKLVAMHHIYPGDWKMVVADVYEWASAADGKWDVVTLDPFTNDFVRCADLIGTWCRLARRAVVLGTGPKSAVTAPAGWRITSVQKRSDFRNGVFWTTLERLC